MKDPMVVIVGRPNVGKARGSTELLASKPQLLKISLALRAIALFDQRHG